MGGYPRDMGKFRAVRRLPRQSDGDLLPVSAPWHKIIQGVRHQSIAARAVGYRCLFRLEHKRTADPPKLPGAKKHLLYIEETPTVITTGERYDGPTTALPQPAMTAPYYI